VNLLIPALPSFSKVRNPRPGHGHGNIDSGAKSWPRGENLKGCNIALISKCVEYFILNAKIKDIQ
jgi:hypothetical protein